MVLLALFQFQGGVGFCFFFFWIRGGSWLEDRRRRLGWLRWLWTDDTDRRRLVTERCRGLQAWLGHGNSSGVKDHGRVMKISQSMLGSGADDGAPRSLKD